MTIGTPHRATKKEGANIPHAWVTLEGSADLSSDIQKNDLFFFVISTLPELPKPPCPCFYVSHVTNFMGLYGNRSSRNLAKAVQSIKCVCFTNTIGVADPLCCS